MTQSDLLKLAQQGDPEAIARLLNRSLQPRGVTAKILIRDNCLKILLSSARPLEQQAFMQFLQRQLSDWELGTIALAKVYSQQMGEGVPAWSQDISLAQGKSVTALSKPVSPSKAVANQPVNHSLPAVSASSSQLNGAIVKVSSAIVKFKSEPKDFLWTLRSFNLKSIFPYHEVFSVDLYRHYAVKLLLFLGLFPLIVNLVAEQVSVAQTAWLLGIYYACIWAVVLHDLIKPAHFSWGNTVKCILFTAFIGIPILLLFQKVPPFSTLYQAINEGSLSGRLLGFVFGVGVLEETCKALPIYFLLLRRGKLSDPHTAAFYGAMSGLGFAIAEGAAYSLRYAFGFSQGHLGLGSFVAANTIRFVSLPLFHAILAGMVGYFMGLAAVNPSRQGAIILIGLAIAAVLHGLYNTFAGSVVGLVIIAFTILLFVTYLRRSRQMVEEMQQAELQRQSGQD
ncbi:MAG TPA: PrsW family glutamic-type intramembrane protease [Coleofasciculaceae cyanobacterium]